MTEETKAQKWHTRLKADCDHIGESPNWSHADMRYFGHLHDLADCGYARSEEVADSLSKLLEGVNSLTQIASSSMIISPERLWELGLAFNKASYPKFSEFDPSVDQLRGLKAVVLELGYRVEE